MNLRSVYQYKEQNHLIRMYSPFRGKVSIAIDGFEEYSICTFTSNNNEIGLRLYCKQEPVRSAVMAGLTSLEDACPDQIRDIYGSDLSDEQVEKLIQKIKDADGSSYSYSPVYVYESERRCLVNRYVVQLIREYLLEREKAQIKRVDYVEPNSTFTIVLTPEQDGKAKLSIEYKDGKTFIYDISIHERPDNLFELRAVERSTKKKKYRMLSRYINLNSLSKGDAQYLYRSINEKVSSSFDDLFENGDIDGNPYSPVYVYDIDGKKYICETLNILIDDIVDFLEEEQEKE